MNAVACWTQAHLPVSFSLTFKPKPKSYCRFSSLIPSSYFGRLRISEKVGTQGKHEYWVPRISYSAVDDSDGYSESGEPYNASDSSKEAVIDIKLPRRSLLVTFTCNACGERSQKLVNRLAYERGTVFVQCSGCFQYHRLVDNLGLVVEYDFRKEINGDSYAGEA